MSWNWQQPDWPEFTWNQHRLSVAEEHFLVGGGIFVGAIKHLGEEGRNQLAVEVMSTEALTTSEIEGEILDRSSVQSSIQRQLGLTSNNQWIAPAERGVSEMMVALYKTFSEPLSGTMLFEWHRMLMGGRRDLADVGSYRTSSEPMQVVSGVIGSPNIHFEALPSNRVPSEMARFIDWFNRSAPSGAELLPALTRAGVVHLYFESIHPFEDGNGRIGRALAEKSLAQSLGQAPLIALAATILARRARYYAALEAANKKNEITEWLTWFGGISIEAQRQTIALLEFIIDKTKLLDRVSGQLNDRQRKALLRMFREGPDGFKGGLSAGQYSSITGASPATTTRDLADLIEKGALIREGERRHARYKLSVPLRPVPHISLNERGELVEE
ncbi:MAG TPA: Fic family protein [Candidatus Acidoferrum sp.]|nr:Fic family protein [Candidatus Acidoferrum sp.]